MNNLKSFRETNNLTQGEVADYLAVTRTFISQIESGYSKLPQDKLEMLLSNNSGWDVSMLEAEKIEGNVQIINGDNRGRVTQINRCPSVADLRERVAELEAQLAAKEQETSWLRSLVEKALKKNGD